MSSLQVTPSRHSTHVHLIPQANILVGEEGTVRIAGLGNASILSHPTVEGKAGTDRLSRGNAPEMAWPGVPPNLTDPTRPTKVSDMYAFGVVAWEVRTSSP